MATSAGDVLQFTAMQSPGANPIINVFHYQLGITLPGENDYAGLAEAFWTHIKTPWRALVAADLGPWFDQIVVDNITNGIDFGVFTISGAERSGTRTVTGDYMGLMPAFPVRLNVGTRLTRPGQKRFGPMYEGDQSGGSIVSGILAIVQTLANACASQILWGTLDAGTMDPVVYGPVIAPHDDSEGRAVAVVNPIVSGTAVQTWTTQRTRRR